MSKPVELVASVGQGDRVAPEIVNPDGTSSPLLIPDRSVCVIQDVSIQRLGGSADPGLFNVGFTQELPTSSERTRWAFVGVLSQNFERSFTSGIAFATPFFVRNSGSSVDAVIVRLWGFLDVW